MLTQEDLKAIETTLDPRFNAEIEFAALRSRVERLEERVERLELNRGFAPI